MARHYTEHVLIGEENNIYEELYHKQRLLEYALRLEPDWLMWVDCDEILDRDATAGGLRRLAEQAPPDVDAYSFHQLNLWRSQTYARTDTKFDIGWFCRLWRVTPDIRFETATGVHLRLYPITIKAQRRARGQYRVIHFGFWDYKKLLVKIGAHPFDRDTLRRIAADNWILNETDCTCYRVPDDIFPPENAPPDIWPQPTPKSIEELLAYSDL